MKFNEVGTTLKHPETINGNVKNLSKRIKMKDKGNVIVSSCLRVIPTSSDLIWKRQNFTSHSKFNRLNSF